MGAPSYLENLQERRDGDLETIGIKRQIPYKENFTEKIQHRISAAIVKMLKEGLTKGEIFNNLKSSYSGKRKKLKADIFRCFNRLASSTRKLKRLQKQEKRRLLIERMRQLKKVNKLN